MTLRNKSIVLLLLHQILNNYHLFPSQTWWVGRAVKWNDLLVHQPVWKDLDTLFHNNFRKHQTLLVRRMTLWNWDSKRILEVFRWIRNYHQCQTCQLERVLEWKLTLLMIHFFLHYLLDYQSLSCRQKNLQPKITNKDGKNCNELYSIPSLKFYCLTQNSLNLNYLDQLGASAYRPWTNNSGRLT